MDTRPKPKALSITKTTAESDIERACVKHWNMMQLVQKKNIGPGNEHWPDRTFINADGLHLYVEFKAPGKLPTPGQIRQINRLRNTGCHVYVIDNVQEGKALLDVFQDSELYIANIYAAADMCAYERAKSEGKIQ